MARRNRMLPDRDFWRPRAAKERRHRETTLAGARQGRVVHVAHDTCLDGASADVLVRLKHGDREVSTLFTEPGDVVAKLRIVAQGQVSGEGRSLLLSDVSPQADQREHLEAALGTLNELGWRIEWRDHHAKQWAHGLLEAVKRKADHVRVDLDNHECGTSIVQQDLLPDDPFAKELALVVRDIDLWIRKDPRSLTLTHALHALGPQGYVAKMVRDRVVLDGDLARAADRYRAELERDMAGAIARARTVQGKHKVGVVYGEFPGSQVCDALRQARGTDIEVNLKPDGKFSIRSRAELPVCQEVAKRFHGGGHPNASGGYLQLPFWEWPAYWASRGRCAEADALVRAAAEA